MKLNREQIIKALERDIRLSIELNYEYPRISYSKLQDAISLIKELTEQYADLSIKFRELDIKCLNLAKENIELTEENERLKLETGGLYSNIVLMEMEKANIKADTVREMQEQLKTEIDHFEKRGGYLLKSVVYFIIDRVAKNNY